MLLHEIQYSIALKKDYYEVWLQIYEKIYLQVVGHRFAYFQTTFVNFILIMLY